MNRRMEISPMKTILIIQARMGSTRLPGKVLKPLGDSTVLDYVVTRCQLIPLISHIIVATSLLPSDDPVEKWCRDSGVKCFRGSEDDVLSRYYECAKEIEPDYIIRVTADCPFLDFLFAEKMINSMIEKPSDIIILEGELPRGLAVEMISFAALKYIYEMGQEARHREHVTYYAYEHSESFICLSIQPPHDLQHPELRITVDTEEDYSLCQVLAEAFESRMDVQSHDIIAYLLDHPEVARINAHVEQKPVT